MSSEILPELVAQDDDLNWLPSSGSWSTLFTPFFKARGIIGFGNQAIIGLWSYNGPAHSAPPVKGIVVKQANIEQFDSEDGALLEDMLLARLRKARSGHILRMFGTTMKDVFQDDPVVRLFLEYCPGDTLARFLPEEGTSVSMLKEIDV